MTTERRQHSTSRQLSWTARTSWRPSTAYGLFNTAKRHTTEGESFARACAKLGVEPKEGSFYPAGSYRIVCQRCGDTKYATESETLRTQGVSMAEFTREFVCPLCYGSIRAECIDAPVFAIGTEVFEVGPDGETCKLIGTVQRP